MKKLFLILLASLIFTGCSNPELAKEELDKGIAFLEEYEKEGNEVNLDSAMIYFENATKHDKSNAEAVYYLGEGISRRKWAFGQMLTNDPEKVRSQTIEASDMFEKVISMSGDYEGRINSLHPREKLDAEWGGLALRYLMAGDVDAAKAAFKEGKSRGAYSPKVLEYCRNLLMGCPEGAVLVTGGDLDTWSTLYLQVAEDVRTDVKTCGFDLMGIPEYRKWLKNDGFPITTSDENLEKIKAVRLKKRIMYPGENLLTHMEFVSRQNSADSIPDSPPIYLSAAMPPNKRGDFLIKEQLEGIAYRIVDTIGSNIVDVERSLALLYGEYTYEYLPDSIPEQPRLIGEVLPRNYASSAMALILATAEKDTATFTDMDREQLTAAVRGATENFPFVWQIWAVSAEALRTHRMNDMFEDIKKKALELYPDNERLGMVLGG